MLDSLYNDPLTGLPNLLSLIMADIDETFGEYGDILYFDMRKLATVNEQFGREMGDSYITLCAQGLQRIVQSIDNTTIYRISGDDFLVVLKKNHLVHIGEITDPLDILLKNTMLEKGFPHGGVRHIQWAYDKPFSSASAVVTKAYMLMQQEVSDVPLPGWINQTIDRMYLHIKDTLTLLSKTSEETMMDSISQMPNNKAAKKHLAAIQDSCMTNGTPFSVLFIDGDNLRRFNDISYERGNEMIRQLSGLIKSSVRADDKVFRWLTGDEFLVVFDETDKGNAYGLAERIRSTVASKASQWEFPVTVSIGVSSFPADGTTIEEVIQKAEKGNSMAKRAGKNCVK